MQEYHSHKPVVFVTGATGYIAQHIIKQLLDSKRYMVVGSIRSEEKAKRLAKLFECSQDLSFEVVQDFRKPNAFHDVFQRCGPQIEYVMHTATSVDLSCGDLEEGIIEPAINGTDNILAATSSFAPNVKKFIYTSSYGAMRSPEEDKDNMRIIDESSWNSLTMEEATQDGKTAYHYAKAQAEKLVWQWQKDWNNKLEVVVICPTFTFGPQCFDAYVGKTLNASCEPINLLVHGAPVNNAIKGYFADVRDVARAHVESLTNDNLNSKRLLISERRFCSLNVAKVIYSVLLQLKGTIAEEPTLTDAQNSSRFAHLDNKATRNVLPFELMSLEQSLKDTVEQILRVEDAK
ncbi:hypothetical protein ACO0QE_000114 [Hanseniaspora vineae]